MPVTDKVNKEDNVPPLNPQPEDTEFVREITLTDKLNKKLLQSFLAHLNENINQEPNQSEELSNNTSGEDFSS